MNQRNRLDEHFSEAAQLLDTVRNDAAFMDAVEAAGTAMCQAIAQGGKIISCGNGGSMSDAMHFAEELSGRYRDDRPGLPAISCSTQATSRVSETTTVLTRSSPDSCKHLANPEIACSPFPQVATVPTYSKQPKPQSQKE